MPNAWAYARQPTLDYQQRVWIEELCISWMCVNCLALHVLSVEGKARLDWLVVYNEEGCGGEGCMGIQLLPWFRGHFSHTQSKPLFGL